MSSYSTSSKTFSAGPPPDEGEGEDAHQDADQHSVQLRIQTAASLSKIIFFEVVFEIDLAWEINLAFRAVKQSIEAEKKGMRYWKRRDK